MYPARLKAIRDNELGAQALPIQAVLQFAGHSNITTTMKYYLAVRQDDIKKSGSFLQPIVAMCKSD